MNITLPWPPSINRYYRSVAMGRGVRVLISKQGREYRKAVQAASAASGKSMQGALRVVIALSPPDRRKRDIDNVLKALLDAMQHAGLYDDDSQIKLLKVAMLCPAPKAGAVEVSIGPLD